MLEFQDVLQLFENYRCFLAQASLRQLNIVDAPVRLWYGIEWNELDFFYIEGPILCYQLN
jgi:hypothetical protein